MRFAQASGTSARDVTMGQPARIRDALATMRTGFPDFFPPVCLARSHKTSGVIG